MRPLRLGAPEERTVKTYYVEYCVWLEAESDDEAKQKADRIEAKIIEERSVSSATVNSVEECDPEQ